MGAKGRAKAVATGKKGAKAGKSEGGDGDTALPAPAMGKDRGKKGKAGKLRKGANREVSWGHDDLEKELACLGLCVKQVTGDGNCFFRSLSDQMEGSEASHSALRANVMDHIRDHQDDFAPFVEDDEHFDKYVKRMRKDGCWAGYMELIAASKMLRANIYVYQPGQPRWVVGDFSGPDVRALHISYHDGQHYNSVRMAGDTSHNTPPQTVVPRPVAAAAAAAAAGADAGAGSGVAEWGAEEEAALARRSGCSDRALLRRCLGAARGDVAVAVEAVVEVLSELAEAEAEAEAAAKAAPGEAEEAQDEAEEEVEARAQAAAGAAAGAAETVAPRFEAEAEAATVTESAWVAGVGAAAPAPACVCGAALPDCACSRNDDQKRGLVEREGWRGDTEAHPAGAAVAAAVDAVSAAAAPAPAAAGAVASMGGEVAGGLCAESRAGRSRRRVDGGAAGPSNEAAAVAACGQAAAPPKPPQRPQQPQQPQQPPGGVACEEASGSASASGAGSPCVGAAADGGRHRRPADGAACESCGPASGSGQRAPCVNHRVSGDGGGDGSGSSGKCSEDADAPAAAVADGGGAPSNAPRALAKRGTRVSARSASVRAPSRNKACPCGSAQKYKNCCGAAAAAAARRAAAAGTDAGATGAADGAHSKTAPPAAAVAAAARLLSTLHI